MCTGTQALIFPEEDARDIGSDRSLQFGVEALAFVLAAPIYRGRLTEEGVNLGVRVSGGILTTARHPDG